jgi:hypothetical protein
MSDIRITRRGFLANSARLAAYRKGWSPQDAGGGDVRVKKCSPLSPTSNGRTFGPEVGFGYVMGYVLNEPVLVLKSCIGNRALGCRRLI